MRRSLALLLLLALPVGGNVAAQALDDVLVPRGHVRLQMFPTYSTWDSRYGRTADGVTGREELGQDLTSPAAETLYPGRDALVAAVEQITAAPGYTPVLGESLGRVTKEVTRIEFGGHIGVFDWLTVGAMLPWTRTHTNVDVAFTSDTINGDLGLNPIATNGAGVTGFLQALATADAGAQAYAGQICSTSPGSPECTSAQDLAGRTAALSASASAAYDASAFFPIEGSATADAMGGVAATLDADLVAAGLAGIGVPMAFATEWVTEEQFPMLAAVEGFGVEGAPLDDVRTLWRAGDVEVTASVRLLEGAVRDSAEAPAKLAYRAVGTLLVRLPTGLTDDPDVFLDVGTGDGQTDIEGRVMGELVLGRRLGLRAAGRYGGQRARTLTRRVAPPEIVLAPIASRQSVEWNPGAFFGVEVAPTFFITPELSVGADYRVYRKYRDSYALTGESASGPYDPVVMEVESGVTVHHVGGTLRYDNVARGLAGETGWPMQLHLRVLRPMAGGGGQTPVSTRLELGIRMLWRLWGAP